MAQAAAVSWRTLLGESAAVGDFVALRGLPNPDAMGLIVRAADDGSPECELGGFGDPPGRARPTLRVREDNLAAVLRKAGGGDPLTGNDYGVRSATPAKDGNGTPDVD